MHSVSASGLSVAFSVVAASAWRPTAFAFGGVLQTRDAAPGPPTTRCAKDLAPQRRSHLIRGLWDCESGACASSGERGDEPDGRGCPLASAEYGNVITNNAAVVSSPSSNTSAKSEVHLSFARRMRQRQKYLATLLLQGTHGILDDRLATVKSVFVP